MHKHGKLAALLVPFSLGLLLSGCGGVKMWPFGDDKEKTVSRGPAGATEYQCAGGKRFYLRYEDKGATAWVIYPDREIALSKSGASRYGNGVATLEFSGSEATLNDGPAVAYTGCKAPAGK